MIRPSFHTPWTLVSLLVLGIVAVPLVHAASHAGVDAGWEQGPSLHVQCDLCHAPCVATAPDAGATYCVRPLAPLEVWVPGAVPSATRPLPSTRGPPLCS